MWDDAPDGSHGSPARRHRAKWWNSTQHPQEILTRAMAHILDRPVGGEGHMRSQDHAGMVPELVADHRLGVQDVKRRKARPTVTKRPQENLAVDKRAPRGVDQQ